MKFKISRIDTNITDVFRFFFYRISCRNPKQGTRGWDILDYVRIVHFSYKFRCVMNIQLKIKQKMLIYSPLPSYLVVERWGGASLDILITKINSNFSPKKFYDHNLTFSKFVCLFTLFLQMFHWRAFDNIFYCLQKKIQND